MKNTEKGKIRTFESGATRDNNKDKLDFEGFFSPIVLREFAKYMNKHRKQSDGKLRDSDNWQKGMPKEVYMKSMWRHFMDVWMEHRGYESRDGLKEALNALLFNVKGYLFELLKEEYSKPKCYICKKEAYTKCSKCNKDICHREIHQNNPDVCGNCFDS